jgi:hypothetical protein
LLGDAGCPWSITHSNVTQLLTDISPYSISTTTSVGLNVG